MSKITYKQLELPLLQVIEELGGSANTKSIYKCLADKLNISEEERSERIPSSPTHRKWDRIVRWTYQNMKKSGLLLNKSARGIWELTEKGAEHLKNAAPGVLMTAYTVVVDGEVRGMMLWGECSNLKHLTGTAHNGIFQAIITSPPFPLVCEKEYGNKAEDKYVDWFLPIAKDMYDSLDESGSLVLNLFPTYVKGMPVQSLYIHKLIIALVEEIGFHIAQECYSHNRGKLPATHYVTVQRNRIVNAVEPTLWLSKSPYPKANNRNVLLPYSESYKKVLKKGGYGKGIRPSGHVIDHFCKDNGGKIAHNLIVANTSSRNRYIRYCKEQGLKVHPARFSPALVDFFIKLLTDTGNIVGDFFGGCNVVGSRCIELGRKFVVVEKSLTYIKGSMGWFDKHMLQVNESLLAL